MMDFIDLCILLSFHIFLQCSYIQFELSSVLWFAGEEGTGERGDLRVTCKSWNRVWVFTLSCNAFLFVYIVYGWILTAWAPPQTKFMQARSPKTTTTIKTIETTIYSPVLRTLLYRICVLVMYVWVICVCPLYLPVFNQGEEGTSWYIIQKGSVNVVIYGKVCVVCLCLCVWHMGIIIVFSIIWWDFICM